MGKLTAKKDRSLSGWDIRTSYHFCCNRSRNQIRKSGHISRQPEPKSDIRYVPNI